MKIALPMPNDLQQTYDSAVNRAVVEAVGKSPGRILDLGCVRWAKSSFRS